jgi:hypothetical protein
MTTLFLARENQPQVPLSSPAGSTDGENCLSVGFIQGHSTGQRPNGPGNCVPPAAVSRPFIHQRQPYTILSMVRACVCVCVCVCVHSITL